MDNKNGNNGKVTKLPVAATDEFVGKSFDFTKFEKAFLDQAVEKYGVMVQQANEIMAAAHAHKASSIGAVLENACGRIGLTEPRKDLKLKLDESGKLPLGFEFTGKFSDEPPGFEHGHADGEKPVADPPSDAKVVEKNAIAAAK